jgi:hypothetical protein
MEKNNQHKEEMQKQDPKKQSPATEEKSKKSTHNPDVPEKAVEHYKESGRKEEE